MLWSCNNRNSTSPGLSASRPFCAPRRIVAGQAGGTFKTATMKTITLNYGKIGRFAIVDDADFAEMAKYAWTFKKKNRNVYAVRSQMNSSGRLVGIFMHRQILNPPKQKWIDHRNRNGLDNRRDNLRTCNACQNSQNRGKSKKNTTGYKGVCFSKKYENDVNNFNVQTYIFP